MSDISEIRMHNRPDTGLSIEPVGTEPKIIYHVDWQQMGQPSPKMFHDVLDAETTLAVLTNYIDDTQNPAVREAYDECFEALQELLKAMIEARDIEGDKSKENLFMGNLHELPEVEKESKQVPAGDSDE